MKYRKKTAEVEAVQWTGENHREMFDFLTNGEMTNDYMTISGDSFLINHNVVKGGLVIKTFKGKMAANVGDYVIKDINGEFYPCKPDIFEKTYEAVV